MLENSKNVYHRLSSSLKKRIENNQIDELLLKCSLFSSIFWGVLTSFFSQSSMSVRDNPMENQQVKNGSHQNDAAEACSAMCFVSLAVMATSILFLFKDSVKKTQSSYQCSAKRLKHTGL